MDESDGPADESSALITIFSGQNLNVYPNGRLSEPNQEMIYSCIGGGIYSQVTSREKFKGAIDENNFMQISL